VGLGNHTGPSAVLRPTGTCIRRSSSPPPLFSGGAAEAAPALARAATEATPRAVVNWRRDTKGMIILDRFSAGAALPGGWIGGAGGGGPVAVSPSRSRSARP